MGLKLRSNKWESTKVSAPSAGYTAGQFITVNDLHGVIAEDAEGDKVLADAILIYKAEKILLPKKGAETLAAGAKVYINDSPAGTVSGSGGAAELCGICLEAVGSDDEEVLVALDGTMGIPGSET